MNHKQVSYDIIQQDSLIGWSLFKGRQLVESSTGEEERFHVAQKCDKSGRVCVCLRLCHNGLIVMVTIVWLHDFDH